MATYNVESKYLLVALTTIAYLSLAAAPGLANPSSTVHSQAVVAASCSPKPMKPGSTYAWHVGGLLAYLVQETPYTDSLSLKARYGGGNAPAFGLATCSASASPADCQSCLQTLSSDIWGICHSALTALVLYPNCSLGYANYIGFSS